MIGTTSVSDLNEHVRLRASVEGRRILDADGPRIARGAGTLLAVALVTVSSSAAHAGTTRAAAVFTSAVATATTAKTTVASSAIANLPTMFTLGTPPSPPALYSITPSAEAVTVSWVAGSDNESTFVVYRRDINGVMQPVYSVPTAADTAAKYSWVDTDHDLSAQCYQVAAVGNLTSWTSEECTVRPDPSRFPQSSPSPTVQWYGLSRVDDGTASLFNQSADQYLEYSDRTWGVSLGWGSYTGSNIKLERPGTSTGVQPLMKGEALALRVWGGGWLVHATQTFGVDLQLSDTPSYEWYVVGAGQPGLVLDDGEFALWNSAANDYLVRGDQVWGIALNWYEKTLPAQTAVAPPPKGVKTFVVYNCDLEDLPVEMWVLDETAATPFSDQGVLEPQWGDSCPSTGQPWIFYPTPGHSYLVEAIDFSEPGCDNDPYAESSCVKMSMPFVGDANGLVTSATIN